MTASSLQQVSTVAGPTMNPSSAHVSSSDPRKPSLGVATRLDAPLPIDQGTLLPVLKSAEVVLDVTGHDDNVSSV